MSFEELSSFALLVGSVNDANGGTVRTPICVNVSGIGTPPVPTNLLWARAYSSAGFVLGFESGDVAVNFPSSSGPSPKQLVGTFDVSFVISAPGYTALPVTYACNNDTLPIAPAPYALQPNPIVIVGGVTGDGVALAGATVRITSSTPPLALPPATTTDANGTYSFDSVPAAQSVVITATGGSFSGSQTISLAYLDPIVTVNFELY
jgi:hypothetical protein